MSYNLGYGQFCLQYLSKVLHQLVLNGVIPAQIAPSVANLFQSTIVEFEKTVIRDIGPKASTEILIKALEIALTGLAKQILAEHGKQMALTGGNYVNQQAMYNPGFTYGDPGLANDPRMLDMQIKNMGINNIASGGMGSVTEKHVLNENPAPVVQPASIPEPTDPTIHEIDHGTGRLLPALANGLLPLKKGGCIVEFIDNQSEYLTTNQKILLRKVGMTSKRINQNIYDHVRHGLNVTEDGKTIPIQLDMITVKADSCVMYFESDRDLFDYMQNNMSASDVINPYFRSIKYGMLGCLEVEHDLFFREYKLLCVEISSKVLVRPSDPIESTDTMMAVLDILDKRDPQFKNAVNSYLLKKINTLLALTLRSVETPSTKITLESLRDFSDLVAPNSGIHSMRENPNFDIVLVYLHNVCMDFMTNKGELMPLCVDHVNKMYGLEPYIKTRKYMSYLPNRPGVCTMDYWKYAEDPAISSEILDMLKSKTLVAETKITIITNIHAPGVLRELKGSMVKGYVAIPTEIDFVDNCLALRYADDKLFAAMNKLRKLMPREVADNLLYCTGPDSYMNLNVVNTMTNVMLLER